MPEANKPDSDRGPSVLVVEDEPDIASMLGKLLSRKFGAEIKTAQDVASARDALAQGGFDIVTLDYQLPDGDGIDLVPEIRAMKEPPQVIMVTGKGDEETAVRAFEAGVSGYVVKDHKLKSMLEHAFSRTLMEVALRRSKARIRELEERQMMVLENVPMLIANVDADGRILYANRAYAEWFDMSADEMVGLRLDEILAPSDLERREQVIGDVLAGHRVSYLVSTKKGERKYTLSVTQVPHVAKDGTVADYFNFLEDVTKLTSAQADLEYERDFFEQTAQNTSIGILTIDIEGMVKFANRAAEDLLDLEKDPRDGKYLYPMLVALDDDWNPVPLEQDPFLEIVRTGQPLKNLELGLDLSRGRKWISMNATPVFDPQGGLETFVVAVTDMTAEHEAHKEERFKASLMRNMADAVITFDERMRITSFNKGAERLYGWREDEMIGRSARVFESEHSEESRMAMISQALEDGVYRFEVYQRRKDGTPVYIDSFSVVLRDDAGRMTGIVTVNRDITEQKRLRDEGEIYHELVQQIPIGLGVFHLEDVDDPTSLRLISANPTFGDLLDLDVVKAIGKKYLEILPGVKGTGRLEVYAEVARGGEAVDLGQITYKDERLGETNWQAMIVPLPGNRMGGIFWQVLDQAHKN